jgi:hypothetical protein
MLQVFAFRTLSVVVGDLRFVDPEPLPGQEGAEQGVRLELRRVEQGTAPGTIYAARPIVVDAPVWRADLLESVDHPGSLDRAHHHPRFVGWDPVARHFVDEMGRDPVAWVGTRLSNLESILDEAGVPPDTVDPEDADEMRAAVPEILDAVRHLLELARRPWTPSAEYGPAGLRAGWL